MKPPRWWLSSGARARRFHRRTGTHDLLHAAIRTFRRPVWTRSWLRRGRTECQAGWLGSLYRLCGRLRLPASRATTSPQPAHNPLRRADLRPRFHNIEYRALGIPAPAGGVLRQQAVGRNARGGDPLTRATDVGGTCGHLAGVLARLAERRRAGGQTAGRGAPARGGRAMSSSMYSSARGVGA